MENIKTGALPMSYAFYKIIHLAGIMLLFVSIGALGFGMLQNKKLEKAQKKPWLITHGISLFLILLGGFGLLARIGIIGGFPIWVWLKLLIWLVMGGLVAFLLRKPNITKSLLVFAILLGISAAYLAGMKPF